MMERQISDVRIFGLHPESIERYYSENQRKKRNPEIIAISIIDQINFANYADLKYVFKHASPCLDEITAIVLRSCFDQTGFLPKWKWEILKEKIEAFYDDPDCLAYLEDYNSPERCEERQQEAMKSFEAEYGSQYTKEKPKPEKGYIYVIKNEKGQYKLGRTKALSSRMNALNKAHGSLEIIITKEVDDYCAVESSLHAKYEEKRIIPGSKNEWFQFIESDIEEIKAFLSNGSVIS